LFLLRRARMRPHRARRYLRAGLPADSRGAALRHPAAPEQDLAHQHDRALMATKNEALTAALAGALGDPAGALTTTLGEVTLAVSHDGLDATLRTLRDDPALSFELMA